MTRLAWLPRSGLVLQIVIEMDWLYPKKTTFILSLSTIKTLYFFFSIPDPDLSNLASWVFVKMSRFFTKQKNDLFYLDYLTYQIIFVKLIKFRRISLQYFWTKRI